MKHLKFLFSLFVLILLVSCNKDKKKEEQYTLSKTEKERILSIVEEALRAEMYLKTGKPLSDINVKVEKVSLEEIEGKHYLVSNYKDYVTNSLLRKNVETMEYDYAGISCTSTKCSSSKGCIPKNEEECTPCGHGVGDCSKTVTKSFPED